MHYDVIIVGAGATGLIAASALAAAGRRVMVLELGPTHQNIGSAINASPTLHRGISQGTASGVGGTTNLWGGQLWPWRMQDFLGRPAVGIPAWSLDAETLAGSANAALALIDGRFQNHQRIHTLSAEQAGRPTPPGMSVSYSTWLGWPRKRFRINPRLRSYIRPVVLQKNARAVYIEEDSAKCTCTVTSSNGIERFTARAIIAAAGTLGNVSLLSMSGLGGTRVGEGFMDHVSGVVARAEIHNARSFLTLAGSPRIHKIRASPKFIIDELTSNPTVLPGYAHWSFPAPKHLSPQQLAMDLARGTWDAGLTSSYPVRQAGKAELRIDIEQAPRSENRIVVNDSGTAELEWCVSASEVDDMRRHGTTAARIFASMDAGATIEVLDTPEATTDIYHMMGGTTMSERSTGGVVDLDCRVYGTDNVFVAGASVFPSGGVSNPTLLAMALAYRLAESIGRG